MMTLSLRCASCGAPLKIRPYTEYFACAYCGSEQAVERFGGTVALKLVSAIEGVTTGTDKVAAELAIVRLERDSADMFMAVEYDGPGCGFPPFPPNDARPTARRVTSSFSSSFTEVGRLTRRYAHEDLDRLHRAWEGYDKLLAHHESFMVPKLNEVVRRRAAIAEGIKSLLAILRS